MYSNEICVTEKKSFDTPLMDFNVMSIDDITQVKTKPTFLQRLYRLVWIPYAVGYARWNAIGSGIYSF